MAEGQSRHVKLTATQRAHAQDAANAMGSDPIRAIVELVTNADDAYDGVATNRKGKIRIEWERHRKSPTILTVSDKARGMTQQEMLHRLGRLGERTSGFESGEQRRGFFGRGAKDVAHFGPARWESKRNGERTRFEIVYRSGATDEGVVTELPRVEKRDTGTTVTLDIQPRFPAPLESTLMDRLRRHYALRPILEDRRGREVTLNGDKVVCRPRRGAGRTGPRVHSLPPRTARRRAAGGHGADGGRGRRTRSRRGAHERPAGRCLVHLRLPRAGP